jgi:hypothetical protein
VLVVHNRNERFGAAIGVHFVGRKPSRAGRQQAVPREFDR